MAVLVLMCTKHTVVQLKTFTAFLLLSFSIFLEAFIYERIDAQVCGFKKSILLGMYYLLSY